MTTERWHRISYIFHAASPLSPNDRRVFLDAACAKDDALRREVESLLTHDTQGPGESLRQTGGLAPGQLLAGRYRIVAFLGRGGMGDVYRADDLQLGQPIALKFLTARDTEWHSAHRDRFLKEVRLARRVSHPNVCRVYDVGEDRGLMYLSMEYVDGEDLSSLLRRIGRLPMEKALQIAQQICAGLAAAHANGILHLDLKPANVMIDGRGVARITDFSIAALQGEATEIAGTPAYMAPEQLSAGSSTVATDVFALGLVLYEMFTGRQAFAAASIQERRAFPPSFEPPAPSSYAPGLDVSIDRTILQCVVNRPTDRPQSAVAVAASLPGGDVLTAWVAAGHVPSPDVVASYGGGTKIRAAPALVLFVATVVGILLAAGNTGAMMFFRHVDFSKSPAVLEDRASAFLDSLEQVAHPVDRASWYTSLYSYAEQANVSWTDRMDSSPAHPVLYVMRQSPRVLAPSNLFATVTFRDPPLDVPGMADIALDGDGALVRFAVVPHRSDPPTSPANWPEIFAAAGLDIRQFSEIPSSNIVPVVADAQFAWTGVHHLWADTPVTVVGATFAGRPVFFDIEHPSVRPVDAGVTAPTERITTTAVLVMLYLAWAGAAVLARHNLRRGQGDRRGAHRVVAYFACSTTAMGLLGAHHVPDFIGEYFTLMRIAAWTALWSASLYLFYLGFEPLVRRRWPHVLASWTSVIAGKWRDRNVGREVLIGVAAGVAALLWLEFEFATAHALLEPPLTFVNFSTSLYAFRDLRFVGSLACFVQSDAVSSSLVSVFVLVLFRELFHRQWLANVAWILIIAPVMMVMGRNPFLELAFAVPLTAFALWVLMRIGLLAFAVMLLVFRVLTFFPVTLDLSVWYAARSIPALVAILLLAGYGYYTAVAPPQGARAY